MLGITRLRNPIQPYPWGSRTAIAELLGRPSPAAEPQAELWMGAHPKAPSEAFVDGRWLRLDDLVRQRPEEILGPHRDAGAAELPFLLKVLAAARGPFGSGAAMPKAGPPRRSASSASAARS